MARISTEQVVALSECGATTDGIGHMSGAVIEKTGFYLLLFLHVVATCIMLSPGEIFHPAPLLNDDHPIHTQRINTFREAFAQSGMTWGYEPNISAGLVLTPDKDVGAKPQQVLGFLLSFLHPFQIEKLFVFLATLSFPLWIVLACRLLHVPVAMQGWVMLVLLGPAWLFGILPQYFIWGMVSFALASYFAPFALALFLRFSSNPSIRLYLAFVLAGATLFLFHLLGPLMLVPALAALTMFHKGMDLKWRLWTVCIPVLILAANAFWFFPFIVAYVNQPLFPFPDHMATLVGSDRHQTYSSVSELFSKLTPIRVSAALGGLFFTIYGLKVMKKFAGRLAVFSFSITIIFGLFLKFVGSFVPVIHLMQPGRFIVPTFAIMTIPAGIGLYTFVKSMRMNPGILHIIAVAVLVLVAQIVGKPDRVPIPLSPYPIKEFVQDNIHSESRILVQSFGNGNYRPHIFPLFIGREVIGNNFPIEKDPAQFLRHWVFGKRILDWSPKDLGEVLDRWGISWVFTRTSDAAAILEQLTNNEGILVGEYQAFKISDDHSRFLVGNGVVQAKINEISLHNLQADDGLIVLRYRYHPGWEASANLLVERFGIPEDPHGFIALRNPPDSVILTFDPWAAIHNNWPENVEYENPSNLLAL